MPHVATSPSDLLEALSAVAHLDGDRLVIDDESGFRGAGIRDLAWTAAFSTDEATTAAAQWLVWEASQELGARSASIQDLYAARGRGEVHGFTVPAINIRAQTFDMARTVFEAAEQSDVGTVILELARSEQTYTYQRPIDYATAVLAGAIAANWRAPVFIQGDHYQFNAKKYAADPEGMTQEIERACRLALDAGYRNIDIDSSTLVDLSKPTTDEQQRENYVRAAELTDLIRTLETDGVTVSVGGEIGEVGHKNSTVEELEAYLGGYRRELDARAARRGRHLEGERPDRDEPRRRAAARRRRGRGQARLRGAPRARRGRAGARAGGGRAARGVDAARRAVPSLPGDRDGRNPPRDRVPERDLRAPGVPEVAPQGRSSRGVFENALDERKEGQTDQQFVYTTRKKAIGPFKRELWELDDEGRDPRGAASQGVVPVPGVARRRDAGTGRSVHPPGRVPSAAARGPPRRRPGPLGAPGRAGWPQSCHRRARCAARDRRGGGGRGDPGHEARGPVRPPRPRRRSTLPGSPRIRRSPARRRMRRSR